MFTLSYFHFLYFHIFVFSLLHVHSFECPLFSCSLFCIHLCMVTLLYDHSFAPSLFYVITLALSLLHAESTVYSHLNLFAPFPVHLFMGSLLLFVHNLVNSLVQEPNRSFGRSFIRLLIICCSVHCFLLVINVRTAILLGWGDVIWLQ